MKKFLEFFCKKVLIGMNACIMTELIQDFQKKVSLENGIQDDIIKNTHLLKKGLSKNL